MPAGPAPVTATTGARRRVCIVGSGTYFLSGISYYTHRLANALGRSEEVSVVLMRQLLPTRLYPGRDRVGRSLASFRYPEGMPTFDGVDWYWVPSMARALRFLRRQHPDVVVLQWWTGTVLHSFLLLAREARKLGARVVVEFHEVQDTGEVRLGAATRYVDVLAPFLLEMMNGAVVHSEWDRRALEERYGLRDRPVAVIPHGPYDGIGDDAPQPAPALAPGCCRLLYFGVIRPFKGVEDLVRAFDSIPEEEIRGYHLTVVGETWEGWTLPADLIAASRYRHRITFVNRYVTDAEVGELFANADAVVLPYHRSSASGPLHLTMSRGLPVVVTRVGGLVEAAHEYEGAVLVPPRDPVALRSAIGTVAGLSGRRFADPHSWERTAQRFKAFLDELDQGPVDASVGGLP